MKSVLFSLLFVFYLSASCYAHEPKYLAGYYIRCTGDTVKGFLQMDNQLPGFNFKKELATSEARFVLFDSCRKMAVDETEYVSWHGRRGMCYVSVPDLYLSNIDSFRTETIPLKLLYSGDSLSLYTYHDVSDHFFAGIHDTIIELAISYRYLTDWEKVRYRVKPPSYFISPFYRTQITELLGDRITSKQLRQVEMVEYDTYSLKKLFAKLN